MKPTPPPHTPAGETHWPGFRPLFVLDSGGSADVHLALHEGAGGFAKLVVLKQPRVQENSTIPHDILLQEARLLSRLNHPNIVQTFEVLSRGGDAAFVMEYVAGQSLSDVLVRAGATLKPTLAIRIVTDLLRALEYAHEAKGHDGATLGLVHRDVTPRNIMLTYDGHTKLLDFESAKLRTFEPEDSFVKGTLRYIAPEQLLGEPASVQTDLYAAGVILWELLSGHRIWNTLGEHQVRAQILAGRFPPPAEHRSDFSLELSSVCLKALSYSAAERYSNASALITALQEVVRPASTHELAQFMADCFATEQAEMVTRIALATSSKTARQPPPSGHTASSPKTSTRAVLLAAALGGLGLIYYARATTSARSNAPSIARHVAPDSGSIHAPKLTQTATSNQHATPTATAPQKQRKSAVELHREVKPAGTTNSPKRPSRQKPSAARSSTEHQPPRPPSSIRTAPRPISPRKKGMPAPHTTPVASSTQRLDTCTPPFIIREGIKMFKRHCLQD